MRKILSLTIACAFILSATCLSASCNESALQSNDDSSVSEIQNSSESSSENNSNSSSGSSEEIDETPRLNVGEVFLSLLDGGTFSATEQLSVLYAPSTVTYKSGDENVATVDENGLISAVAIGETSITVTCEGVEEMTCKVQVASGAIKSKADLDFLANAYKENNLSLWGAENYYVLANDIDYAGETFTPIAPLSATYFQNEDYPFVYKWGVFGELNDNHSFAATLDGKGHEIVNAVIPYGTVLCENNGGAGAFIGNLSGTLKNVALKNVKTQNVIEFKEANPTTDFSGTWDVNQMQGIVSLCTGKIQNVYAELLLQTAAYGQAFSAGGLVAKNETGGTLQACITKMSVSDDSVWDGGIVGRFWNGVNGGEGTFAPEDIDYLSDVGLIVGTNNGAMENCFTLVQQTGFKTTGHTSVHEYLPMFYGGFYSGWWAGPNYTKGMGNGTFENLRRYVSLEEFIGSTSDSMFTRWGFDTEMWYGWWGIVF